MQTVLHQVSILSANVYTAGKYCDESFNYEALCLVQESAITPLRQKKQEKKSKATANATKKRSLKPTTLQEPETPPRRSSR
jgi:hypothetical protein